MGQATEPFSQMNTTPVIDVLLVLLIMLIVSVPIAKHCMEVDLRSCSDFPLPDPEPVRNKIVIDADDRRYWNGRPVGTAQLATLRSLSADLPVEPEPQFEPAARASYRTTANTLNLVKARGITKFGFLGNERYHAF